MLKKRTKYYPLVSVILNCHNGEQFINKSVQSILNQTYKNWELIFLDNNSDDKTRIIIKKIKDKRIKYFKTKKIFKLYRARNIAISKAKGKLISFLDVDDWWKKDKLKIQVSTLESNKQIDVLYSNVFLFYEKINKKKLSEGKITQSLINDFKMPIVSTILKKSIFKNIKFDNNYEIIGDFDFLVRLSLNTKISAIQKPLAYYRIHGSNLSIKKMHLNISELEKWVKKNKNKKKFKKYNFFNIQKLIQILKIKNSLILGKKKIALKHIFRAPFFISKFKFFILFFLSKNFTNRILNWLDN